MALRRLQATARLPTNASARARHARQQSPFILLLWHGSTRPPCIYTLRFILRPALALPRRIISRYFAFTPFHTLIFGKKAPAISRAIRARDARFTRESFRTGIVSLFRGRFSARRLLPHSPPLPLRDKRDSRASAAPPTLSFCDGAG